ncbi:hypothetical protein SLEP1_g28757 [Rubroshorea leprosula]|uniref:Uncharacterized protein n=1 Tax=Rubroshorea leprosula TaxID=152421 RepID=A0AAV5K144_9ROSI|nr:hypothetical protein SLEP1_g28757 [Rubroshorea leprosula]
MLGFGSRPWTQNCGWIARSTIPYHLYLQGEAKKALEVLRKPSVLVDLQYKFAPDLIALDAYETVESWMASNNLNPRNLYLR